MSKVHQNYKKSSQFYQLECSVRVLFLPEFNVWQIHKLDYSSWKALRLEIVGYENSQQAFEFAMLYVKLLKYGLNKEEMIQIQSLGYDILEDEFHLI